MEGHQHWILYKLADRGSFSYLQVFKYVKTDPVTVRVCDKAQAHVGSGVVEVTDQVHCLPTAFGTQHGVQFFGSDYLVGGRV